MTVDRIPVSLLVLGLLALVIAVAEAVRAHKRLNGHLQWHRRMDDFNFERGLEELLSEADDDGDEWV